MWLYRYAKKKEKLWRSPTPFEVILKKKNFFLRTSFWNRF